MIKKTIQLSILIAVPLLVALACNAPVLVPTAEPLPSPTPTWTLLPPPSPTPGPTDTPVPPTLPPDEPTPAPTLTSAPFACPGAPEMRVQVGDAARVTFSDGLPLRVRETPVVNNSNVLAQIPEGTEFTIIDGPECAPIPSSDGSFVFWKIKVNSTGLEGWVAEGDSTKYYIEPVP